MNQNPKELVSDFLKVAKLAGVDQAIVKPSVEVLPAPHTPPKKLPKGKMAVYVFSYHGKALKVGKAGPNSNARYTSQHYDPNRAPSTLAASLLKSGSEIGITGINRETISEWIKKNTDRVNILIDSKGGKHVLALLESFVQCRLRPVFEGHASQR